MDREHDRIDPPAPDERHMQRLSAMHQTPEVIGGRIVPPRPDEEQLQKVTLAKEHSGIARIPPPKPDESRLRHATASKEISPSGVGKIMPPPPPPEEKQR